MQTEEKKKWHKEVEAKEKTVERKCFHSFNYVINLVILSVLLVVSFKLRLPQFYYKYMNF